MNDDDLKFQLRRADLHFTSRSVRTRWRKLSTAFRIAGVLMAAAVLEVSAAAGERANPFFAMDTGTRDARHKTPAEQVVLGKEIGFAGVGPTYHNRAELQEWLAALDLAGLQLFTLYLPLNLDDTAASLLSLKEVAAALRSRNTLLWLYVTDKERKPSSSEDDEAAVKALREAAVIAKDAGLRVALYPHAGLYVERVEDAVRLVEKAGCANLGVTFNLCHWLKVDGKDLEASLEAARPHLFCVTINGADTGGGSWKDLIQPLDRGTYDVSQLLRFLRKTDYTGPIGLQHYGIGGDASENLRRSMSRWKNLSSELLDQSVPPLEPLWRIGRSDQGAAEFALAQGGYPQFLQRFGSPDHAFYVGLSESASDWPCVLPGPLDAWAGGNPDGSWDQMNTLPIGFVLAVTPSPGRCALVVDVCDASTKQPPRLRITVNNAIYEVEVPPGGGDESLRGDYSKAKAHVARIEFPASLLRVGYNEIALRTTRGSWLAFRCLAARNPVRCTPGTSVAYDGSVCQRRALRRERSPQGEGHGAGRSIST